jgi:hypothetical protein
MGSAARTPPDTRSPGEGQGVCFTAPTLFVTRSMDLPSAPAQARDVVWANTSEPRTRIEAENGTRFLEDREPTGVGLTPGGSCHMRLGDIAGAR